jgi:hypothetical protein
MKIALSIALGGEVVTPQECDYSSYSQLGLICPACSNPVFLVAATKVRPHTRKNKDIAAFVRGEHFSHFYEKDRLLECENRSSDISSTEAQLYQSTARNQRLQVFVSGIYEILQLSPALIDLKFIPQLLNQLLSEVVGSEPKAAAVYQAVGKAFWVNLKTNQGTIKDLLHGADINHRIATEAFTFILSEHGAIVATTLFWHAYYHANQAAVLPAVSAATQYTRSQFQPVFDSVALDLVGYLLATPWIQGFQNNQRPKQLSK